MFTPQEISLIAMIRNTTPSERREFIEEIKLDLLDWEVFRASILQTPCDITRMAPIFRDALPVPA